MQYGAPPLPGEAVHTEHLLSALRIALDQAPPPRHPVAWRFELVDDGTYTLRPGDHGWALVRGADSDPTPDVVVTADAGTWIRFLMTPSEERPARPSGIDLAGPADEIDRFLDLIEPFPYGHTA